MISCARGSRATSKNCCRDGDEEHHGHTDTAALERPLGRSHRRIEPIEILGKALMYLIDCQPEFR
jgi:hypothetical protein